MELPQSIDYEELLNHEGDGPVACKELKLDISGQVVDPWTNVLHLIYIVGSCNGLICLHGLRRLCFRHWDFVLVWNPSTGDTCRLPMAPPFRNCSFKNLLPKLFGFGYDSTSEDYKVMLGNMSSTGTDCITQIFIFALKTGSWRCYEDCRKIEELGYVRMGGQGSLSNGALHWIELVFDSDGWLDGSRSKIVAFDLAEEQFREMASLSSFIDKEYLEEIHVNSDILIRTGITIENSLIVYFYNRSGDQWTSDRDTTLAVWLMKEYGNENSWTRFLSNIPLKILVPTEYDDKEHLSGTCDDTMNDFLFPIHILEDGKVLMSCDEEKLVLYDPKENTARTVLETVEIIHPTLGKGT